MFAQYCFIHVACAVALVYHSDSVELASYKELCEDSLSFVNYLKSDSCTDKDASSCGVTVAHLPSQHFSGSWLDFRQLDVHRYFCSLPFTSVSSAFASLSPSNRILFELSK